MGTAPGSGGGAPAAARPGLVSSRWQTRSADALGSREHFAFAASHRRRSGFGSLSPEPAPAPVLWPRRRGCEGREGPLVGAVPASHRPSPGLSAAAPGRAPTALVSRPLLGPHPRRSVAPPAPMDSCPPAGLPLLPPECPPASAEGTTPRSRTFLPPGMLRTTGSCWVRVGASPISLPSLTWAQLCPSLSCPTSPAQPHLSQPHLPQSHLSQPHLPHSTCLCPHPLFLPFTSCPVRCRHHGNIPVPGQSVPRAGLRAA